MGRTTKTISLSLSPEMMKQIETLMREEGRTRSELFREALRRYVADKEWKDLYRYGEMKARESGVGEDQVEDLIDAQR